MGQCAGNVTDRELGACIGHKDGESKDLGSRDAWNNNTRIAARGGLMEPYSEVFSLKGKISLVTGGSRGIGLGGALALARSGSDLCIVSRGADQLKETANGIREATGQRVFTVCADLTRLEEVERAYHATIAEYGRVDVLLYAAGTNIRKPFLEITPSEFDLIVSLNLRSAHFLSQMVAKGMVERCEGGRIILICSISSHMGMKNVSAYAPSKGGAFSLTKAMAVELAEFGITVNSISPGFFRTAMTEHRFKSPEQIKWMTDRIPLKRVGMPDDIGGAVVFLASPASAYLTGVNIYVDGGWTAA